MRHNITRGATALIATTIAITTLAAGAAAADTTNQPTHPQAPITAPAPHSNEPAATCFFRFNANGVAIRKGPSTHYPVKGHGNRGQKAYYTDLRQRHGQLIHCPPRIARQDTNVWSLVRNGTTGVVGWVNNCFFY